MNKQELILKWLNNDLSPEELEAFKQLDEYDSYVKLSEKAKFFAAPYFDEDASLTELRQETKKPAKTISIYKYIAAVAAVFVIGFLVFKSVGLDSSSISHQTIIAEVKSITLPDSSTVSLNSNSTLRFNEEEWKGNRTLDLEGEALFTVEKGEKFKVNTAYGEVQVLGTIFNVKSRDYAFQVTCFEGTVQVNIDDQNYILNQNDRLLLDAADVVLNTNLTAIPSWKQNMTVVKDQSLDYIIKELNNYYEFDFDTSRIDTSKRFTGSFDNLNINLALNSITLPLGLTYEIDGETVIFDYK
mgnify:CR=1 FL=1